MTLTYAETVRAIVDKNRAIAAFWSKAHGWAPLSVAQLLGKSRLDRQVSISLVLNRFQRIPAGERRDGELILGWATLRCLAEGTLKWFLSVYYQTYRDDKDIIKLRGKAVEPDGVTLAPLLAYFDKKVWAADDSVNRKTVAHIQNRGNAIHAYKDRELGTPNELRGYVSRYYDLLFDLDGRVPYPE